jgi:heterodisulfide reductase subunit B
MKVAYFPGCSMHGTSREYGESLRAVAEPLGVELDEVRDWNCCGASSAHASSRMLAVALPARSLALAEAQGHERLLAPCAACYNRLAGARHEIAEDAELAGHVKKVLARPFENRVAVLNVVEVLRDLGETLRTRVTSPLKGLKVACYYGCLLVRPAAVTRFDDPEDPTSMESVVRACGAEPVAWRMKLDCCGGGFSLSRKPSVVRLGRAIIDDARKAGADVIAVACPMCHSNLDFRQKAMARDREDKPPMPIVFITQVVGLAMGIAPDRLGMQRHFVSTKGVAGRGNGAAAEVG